MLWTILLMGCSGEKTAKPTEDEAAASSRVAVMDRLFLTAGKGDVEGLKAVLSADTTSELDQFFSHCSSPDEGWRGLAASLCRLHRPECRKSTASKSGYRLTCHNLAGDFTLDVVFENGEERISLPSLAALNLDRVCPGRR